MIGFDGVFSEREITKVEDIAPLMQRVFAEEEGHISKLELREQISRMAVY